MLSTKTISTVYGIDNMMVGKMETRATNQICSRISRHAHGPRTAAASASALSKKNWPSAVMGLAMAVAFTVLARSFADSTRPPYFVTRFIRS